MSPLSAMSPMSPLSPTTPLTPPMTIRSAYADDAVAILRLAALDSAPAPREGALLVAEIEGELVAALCLLDGAAIADPFLPTAGIVRLLRARAAQLGERPVATARRASRLRAALRFA